ncbi:MAG: hypothetical protein Q9213_008221 [Squamulea squamosa]
MSPADVFNVTSATLSTNSVIANLEQASLRGDLTTVRSLLGRSTSADNSSILPAEALSSSLNLAISYGQVEVVQILLNYGAPITISSAAIASRADTPNPLAIYECFFKRGWSVMSPASKDGTLTAGLIMSHPDAEILLRWFLDHGALANGLPENHGSLIRAACLSASSSALVSILLAHGADVQGTNALHAATASLHGDDVSLATMTLLLDAGADIHEIEYEGRSNLPRGSIHADWGTALHKAAKEGSVGRALLLIERGGADLAKKSRLGYTARDTAQLFGKAEVAEVLERKMQEIGMVVQQLQLPEEDSEEDIC